MKAFYSLLLIVIFLMQVDAQPAIYIAPKAIIKDTADSTISIPPVAADSILLAKPDSISLVAEEELPAAVKPKTINGIASFYSKNLEGTETATGETFKHAKYTGASNNLPLNTWVRVTNINNGKSVVVRINDRMHPRMAKKGRVIDLTIAAAKKIGLTSKIGLTKVSLEVIDKNEENRDPKEAKSNNNIAVAK
ncbi:septal ring lytic transglycosylase RlpA family protein [Panacibacter ginsenosidivorans]|uniref:Probable endolytic peptidoglycan transglycosylase RlpA n=1 Tax=Panacibacter ginsenosidivorans TaxID=1813871 RepID=A0A5B8VDE3_9BACT|nr:septal ring lytic transglycosylase RlpA family protein [Panacibacter ginsenosidivorans]QEC69013.1 septal ring lytic transglycosylase RlpA family protein [Panacibacter ginsenosidivorans]